VHEPDGLGSRVEDSGFRIEDRVWGLFVLDPRVARRPISMRVVPASAASPGEDEVSSVTSRMWLLLNPRSADEEERDQELAEGSGIGLYCRGIRN